MNRFTFSPNVPQLIALADPQGDYNSDQEQVEYPLADGRILVLNTSEATRLNMLDLQIGETFWITKRVTPGQVPYIEMTLSPAVPVRKRARVRAMPATQPPEQPRLFDRKGTGTYGPAPEMQPAPLRRPAIVAQTAMHAVMVGEPRPTIKPWHMAVEILESGFWIWGILHFWGRL
jgi:hypothetical protein